MKALAIGRTADGARYELAEVPEPSPGPDDLLVAVRASAINQADLRYAASHFAASEPGQAQPGAGRTEPGQAQPGPVGGLEMAGEVVALGERVAGFAVGDRVMAMTGRAWAELVAVDHRLAVPVPAGFGWPDAGATPVSFITAHDCVTAAAAIQPGESLLVQGATTAAGLAVVQIASRAGARPILGTTSSPAKAEQLRRLGCDIPLVRGREGAGERRDDVARAVRSATADRGADVVVDILGGGALRENIDAAAVRGRIICLGRVAGTRGELDLDEFARKRIQMTGVTFRTRTADERRAVVARFIAGLLPALEAGEIRPVTDRCFDWSQVAEAEAYLRTDRGGTRSGKVVLQVSRDRGPG